MQMAHKILIYFVVPFSRYVAIIVGTKYKQVAFFIRTSTYIEETFVVLNLRIRATFSIIYLLKIILVQRLMFFALV